MYTQHVISASQFDKKELLEIMKQSSEMEQLLETMEFSDMAKGKILATFFYEPSTRTRLSFEAAMNRLGGTVISVSNGATSSAKKGETVEDTMRVISGYADVIAMRSSEIGYAERATKTSSVPIINGGDGPGEHPTQSLLDLYTIKKQFGLENRLRVVFVGDLKNGRTVHSLQKLLRNFDEISIDWVSPKELEIQDEYFDENRDQKFNELTNKVLSEADVIYMTRIQKERFENQNDYERLKDVFILDAEKVAKMKNDAIVLHPLPRVDEISTDVDPLPHAKYFEQAQNGVPVRMALIARALKLI
jgi:aspartate carbamoyltransferase catalytic subunit